MTVRKALRDRKLTIVDDDITTGMIRGWYGDGTGTSRGQVYIHPYTLKWAFRDRSVGHAIEALAPNEALLSNDEPADDALMMRGSCAGYAFIPNPQKLPYVIPSSGRSMADLSDV